MAMYPNAAWLSPKGVIFECDGIGMSRELVHFKKAREIWDIYYPGEQVLCVMDDLIDRGWVKISHAKDKNAIWWTNCGLFFTEPLTDKQIEVLIKLERWDSECEIQQEINLNSKRRGI